MFFASIMAESLQIFVTPQCLVESTHDCKLAINQTVFKEMKKLDKPVVVVVIAGPYRTGKSYLMNRLADLRTGQLVIQFCGEILAFNNYFIQISCYITGTPTRISFLPVRETFIPSRIFPYPSFLFSSRSVPVSNFFQQGPSFLFSSRSVPVSNFFQQGKWKTF